MLYNVSSFSTDVILKPTLSKKGWDVFEALNKKQIDSRQAFVAMWFSNEEDRKITSLICMMFIRRLYLRQ